MPTYGVSTMPVPAIDSEVIENRRYNDGLLLIAHARREFRVTARAGLVCVSNRGQRNAAQNIVASTARCWQSCLKAPSFAIFLATSAMVPRCLWLRAAAGSVAHAGALHNMSQPRPPREMAVSPQRAGAVR